MLPTGSEFQGLRIFAAPDVFDTSPHLKSKFTPISISVKSLKHFNRTLYLLLLLKLISMISVYLHLNG
jgi:aspartyl/asparaginyl beta-hydroxylase (cupin superfamily)